MRKLVLSLILALGFAVCFAAPPPDPVRIVDDVTMVSPEKPAMLVATPCIVMQDLQPAPLLITQAAIKYCDDRSIIITQFKFLLPPESDNKLVISDGRIATISNDLRAHSSGGLPY